MSENTVVISEKDGKYQITNNGIPELTLLGILECVVFEMKTAKRQKLSSKEESPVEEQEMAKETMPEQIAPEPTAPQSNAPELRTRIGNAVKAIKDLGGEVPDFDADAATDKQLQEELKTLTEQYKRLKNSKAAKR